MSDRFLTMFCKNKIIFLLLLMLVFTAGFMYAAEPDPAVFGDGSDGTIYIKSGYTVLIRELYENDDVDGVETHRGVNKGLNHGTGTYHPQEGRMINAVNFIIEADAVLTANEMVSGNNDLQNGNIVIRCTKNFINNGTINLDYKGYRGSTHFTQGGYGPGGGFKKQGVGHSFGSEGGEAYPGDVKQRLISNFTVNFSYLCGSGGAHGSDGKYSGGHGGGGGGGLAVFVYNLFDNSKGIINSRGENGGRGSATSSRSEGCSAGGGGGAGGTVFIYVKHLAQIGNNRINVSLGAGGPGAGPGSSEPDHAGGGGGGANKNNGTRGYTSPSDRYSGGGGAGSIGRVCVTGPYTGYVDTGIE